MLVLPCGKVKRVLFFCFRMFAGALLFSCCFYLSVAYPRLYVPRWNQPTLHIKYCDKRVALVSPKSRVVVVDTCSGEYLVDFVCPGHVNSVNLGSDVLLVDYYNSRHHVSTMCRLSSSSVSQVMSRLPPRFSTITKVGGQAACLTVYIDGTYACYGLGSGTYRGTLDDVKPFTGYHVYDEYVVTCCGTSELQINDVLSGKCVERVSLPGHVQVNSVVMVGFTGRKIKTCHGFFTTRDNTLYRFSNFGETKITKVGYGHHLTSTSTPGVFLVSYYNYVGVLTGGGAQWHRLPYAESCDVGGSTLVWTTGFNMFSLELKKYS